MMLAAVGKIGGRRDAVELAIRAPARADASATSHDVQLAAFELSALTEFTLPADGHIVSEPVRVTRIRYPGHSRVGLLATCQCGEHTYDVSLADVAFPQASAAAKLVARYRAWLGFDASDGLKRPSGILALTR